MGNLDAEGEYVTPVYDIVYIHVLYIMYTSVYSAIQHRNDSKAWYQCANEQSGMSPRDERLPMSLLMNVILFDERTRD